MNRYLQNIRKGSFSKTADEIELEELKAAMTNPENILNQDKMAEIQTRLQEMIDRRTKAGLPMDVTVSPSDLVDPELQVDEVLSDKKGKKKIVMYSLGGLAVILIGGFIVKKKMAD